MIFVTELMQKFTIDCTVCSRLLLDSLLFFPLHPGHCVEEPLSSQNQPSLEATAGGETDSALQDTQSGQAVTQPPAPDDSTGSSGSSGRQRRFGHSSPPTGDFQLVVGPQANEDDEDTDEEEEGAREGGAGRSQAVPFWSYG